LLMLALMYGSAISTFHIVGITTLLEKHHKSFLELWVHSYYCLYWALIKMYKTYSSNQTWIYQQMQNL
jgi:hypothetical protein